MYGQHGRLGALLAAILMLPAFTAGAQEAPVPVGVTPAATHDVPIYTRGIGTVQAYRSVLVRARVDGAVEQIAFREGQDVKPGDLLAVIDPRPYAAALAQVQAKRAADTAQMANARLDLQRYANLSRTNFASRQQVDTQTATVGQDAANLQGDEAAIAAAQLNLSFCRIESPINGVVGLRLVDIGNLVHASDTQGLVSITQVQPISLVFTLPEDELPRIRDAMAHGTPAVAAFTSDNGTLLSTGTLLTTNNAIDTATGTIALKATFDNADRKLWPGQFVSARLQFGTAQNAVTVPPAAIQHGPDGLYVYVVDADHTARRRPVKLGYQGETEIVVTEGLHAGEPVIVSGQSRVEDGKKVDAKTQEVRS